MDYTHAFYVYLNAGWTDITAYTKTEYGVRVNNIGMQSNKWTDRIAAVGTITFYVDNSTGLFDPALSTCYAGWKKGAKIKHVVSYDGASYTKFYGYIDALKLNDPSVYVSTVQVTANNFFRYIYNYPIVAPSFQTDATGNTGITTILNSITQTAQNVNLDTGDNTFDALFDTVSNSTTASTEINKIVQSEGGYFYCQNDKYYGERLRFEKNSRRSGLSQLAQIPVATSLLSTLVDENNNILTDESGVELLGDEAENAAFSTSIDSFTRNYAENVVNRIRIVTYPKDVGSSAVTLYTLRKPAKVGAGQTITIRGKYTDPNGGKEINSVPSSCSFTYTANTAKDGSGTNLTSDFTVTPTYGTEAPSFIIENGSIYRGYLTSLVVSGYSIKNYDSTESIYQDTTSQADYGVESVNFDQLYQNDTTFADQLGAYILEMEKNPRVDMDGVTFIAQKSTSNMAAFLNLNVGDLIQVTVSQVNENSLYWIQGISYSIDSGGNVTFTYKLKKFWSLSLGLSLVEATFGNSDDALSFGNVKSLIDLQDISYTAWVYMTGAGTRNSIMGGYVEGAGGYRFYADNSRKLSLDASYSVNGGLWTGNTALSLNAWHFVAVTKRFRAEDNPAMYIDNSAQTITTTITPVGALLSNDGQDFCVGNLRLQSVPVQFAFPFIGKIKDARVYNRELTAAELSTMYSAGPGDMSVTDGLVFQGPTIKTLESDYYDGHTMTSTDRVIDNIYGAIGVPNGTPIISLP